MPYWTLTLVNPEGDELSTFQQTVTEKTAYAVWIEGNPSEPEAWHFTSSSDETQVKSDLICQFNFKAAGLRVSTELSDTFIKPPSDSTSKLDSRIRLDYSCESETIIAVLRNGDVVEFQDQKASVRVVLGSDDPTPGPDSKVEVTSSRPLVIDIKEEPSSDAETDDKNDLDEPRRPAPEDESQQHLYSTSRENQSPTSRMAADSQVIKETPSRKRIRSQHESTVFDSINMSSLISHAHPSAITQPEPDLPGQSPHRSPQAGSMQSNGIPSNELPDTLQDSYPPDLYSEPGIGLDGHGSTNDVVDQVVRSLNESQSPPPRPDVPEFSSVKLVDEPVSSVSEEAVNPPTESPGGESASVGDATHKDANHEDANDEDPDNITVSSGTPNSSSNQRSLSNATPASRSSGKRKRLGAIRSTRTKRVKINDETSEHDEDLPAATPLRTASRRSSSRIRTSRSASHDSSRHYSGPPPKILFSNTKVDEINGLMRFLKSHKATKTDSTTKKGSNFLCVGNGELKTTAKLLHSLTQGKSIVTEDWVLQSSKEKVLLDPADFLPDALKGTMDQNRDELFSGQVIYITPKLRQDYGKQFDDIQAIIRQAGGTNPLTGPLNKLKSPEDITIHIGAETKDSVAEELHNSDVVLFKKELIGASIVHGSLLVENEDMILSPDVARPSDSEKSDKPKKARRKR